ncbi:hypothetical protein CTI12_AA201090 [Artemisia annua]|uniref:Ulp1 protease family, C-terminal catalytic domain-containing protein n=1 Tax=Artemisia annua TaxID=35608 RepID=A0A2U1P263_ARTAN|nr:hypothetical protein CTI12_AA201090 [Artemisia annua]
MSPRSLQKVLESLTKPQVEELDKMGFGAFQSNFSFDSTPSKLGMWIVRNFDPKTCSIKMKDGRKLKITRELVRDVLGIPMGDIKVEALEEINLLEETTVKWRKQLESIVVKNKIFISKLEEHLCGLTEVDWEFRVCFIVLFFSIFGQGNKDGEVNERIIHILSNTDNVPRMDWCSYVVECIVKACTGFNPYSSFNGPLLLLAIIYVNSTKSETIKVEKTVPAFKAWNSKLLYNRQKEELDFGFGCLQFEEGDEEENLVNQLQTRTIDIDEANKEFTSKSFEEMKLILRDNLVLCNQLMLDTDYKFKIALRLNPDDEQLKKMVEIRKDLFADSYTEHSFDIGNEKDGDKDGNKDVNGEDENHENGEDNNKDGNGVETDELGNDGNEDNHQMGGQDNDGKNDEIAVQLLHLSSTTDKGRDENGMKVVGDKVIDEVVVDREDEKDENGNDGNADSHQMGDQDNEDGKNDEIVVQLLKLSSTTDKGRDEERMKVVGDNSTNEAETHTEFQEPKTILSNNNKRRKLNPEVDVSLSH